MARWLSEPFGANGGSAGSGIKNQLGRPQMPHYTVLVREAVQNSWDARVTESIRVSFEIKQLGKFASAWRETLVHGVFHEEQRALSAIDEESLILVVSDRGTSGLGGPLRADEPIPEGVSADFVQFMRNIGEPRDTALGGGTYGYGKSIFYRSSHASTILVNTRVSYQGHLQQRLMGASITDPYEGEGKRRFTGRHWWGEVRDDVVMPLLDGAAKSVCENLGLSTFDGKETGTDIVVLLPDLSLDDLNGDVQKLANSLRGAIYWHLWPKMVRRRGQMPIKFELRVHGHRLEFPELSGLPILADFADALNNLDSKRSSEFSLRKMDRKIGSYIETIPIGYLETRIHLNRLGENGGSIKSIMAHSPFQPPVRHIARMRSPELVVDYFQGDQLTFPEIGYVGVFKVCDDFDEVFASSEPPTHDNWASSMLSGNSRGIVRESVAFLNRKTSELVKSQSGAQAKVVRGLARLSSSLGAFVEVTTGPKLTTDRSAKQRNGKGRKTKKDWSVITAPGVVVIDGAPVTALEIEVSPGKNSVIELECHAEVMLGNGRAEHPRNAPLGAEMPKEAAWRRLEGMEVKTGNRVRFSDGEAGIWRVAVPCLERASIRLRVREVK